MSHFAVFAKIFVGSYFGKGIDKDSNYLNIELQDKSYKRIILNIDNNDHWQQQPTQMTR